MKDISQKNKKVLVTGAAGFIGFYLCKKLINLGLNVVGIDNINEYYDVKLKYARLNKLGISQENAKTFNEKRKSELYGDKFYFLRINLEDFNNLPYLFKIEKFDAVFNLAAQAGVRYSIKNPQTYINSNIQGFLNILECCRNYDVPKLIYASSSSVYGNNTTVPYKEMDNVDYPVSLYAATKKSNELMAHTYSHLYDFQTIGLRFFTVYGPWGRPDMAYFLFTEAILKNKSIDVFNNGNLSRDFTYIDDIINGIVSIFLNETKKQKKYQLLNIGNNKPVNLLDFIREIENNLDKKAKKNMLGMQPGDVENTWADISQIYKLYNYKPETSIQQGIEKFIKWFKIYHKIS